VKITEIHANSKAHGVQKKSKHDPKQLLNCRYEPEAEFHPRNFFSMLTSLSTRQSPKQELEIYFAHHAPDPHQVSFRCERNYFLTFLFHILRSGPSSDFVVEKTARNLKGSYFPHA
jgi:hypothetical protein